ncbi:pseudouridylate synthase [Metallosphaera tengchongensis]|uniref:Pseudouridylate synthase n=1 Tax=Metallosphaera tengchongensis TaxID=1532350 RepID=A0A6N0NVD9_9CREN|nr:pseudouridylate synthase [Metallosphaera tengchongensis]QKQ99397.1 pseudouridylate synthase [Metallosphaera tengchongensis]
MAETLVDQALRLLEKYPLCDSCLGRCFAKLGHGYQNRERGRAIKLSILMELDRKIKGHQLNDLNEIREVLFNSGEVAKPLYEHYFKDPMQERTCYLCNNSLDEIKEDFLSKSLKILRERKVGYVLGVRLSVRTQELETSFATENGLIFYESMKNEIRREVGKRLSSLGYEPEIDKPEVELVYDVETREVKVTQKTKRSLYLYTRFSRDVPISSWYSKGGESLDQKIKGKIIVPFTEPSSVRILEFYPIVLEEEPKEGEYSGYIMRRVGPIGKKEFNLLVQSKPTVRYYRVTFFSENRIGHEIYAGIQDVVIQAKNYEELSQKLREMNVSLISVDLLKTEGRHRRVMSLLTSKRE